MIAMSVLRNIVEGVRSGRSVTVLGGRGAAPQRLAVAVQEATQRRVVMVLADPRTLHGAWCDLYHLDAVFGRGRVRDEEVERPEIQSDALLLQAPLHSPYQDVAGDFAGTMARQAALTALASGAPWRHLVLPASMCLSRMPRPEVQAARALTLKAEMEIEPFELSRHLAAQGYHASSVVESPGTFAGRGGTMDIFPPTLAVPVRLQWYGPFIERMRLFDPDTQRTRGDADTVVLPPLSEIPVDEERFASATSEIHDLCLRQDVPTHRIRDFLDGLRLQRWVVGLGVRRFLPIFYPDYPPLLETLPDDALLMLIEPQEILDAAQRAWESLGRDFEELRARDEPACEPERLCLPAGRLPEALARFQTLRVHVTSVPPQAEADGPLFDLNADDHGPLIRQCRGELAEKTGSVSLKPLARQIRLWLAGRASVTLAALGESGAERLRDLLQRYGIGFEDAKEGQARLSIGPASSGYYLESEAEVFLAEEQIFGRKVRGRRAPAEGARQIEDLRSLAPGDFVVHKIHGVGRYEGQVMQTFDASTVELIKILYRDGDILYVPVYHLNQVQKYIGGKPQVLDKLGGETFLRTKKRTQKAAMELAERLLQLYAERKAAQRPAYPGPDRDYYEFESLFPYEETHDQRRAVDEIMKDLAAAEPMDRLLCGDVGFGKTEVAVRAAYRVALSGKQVAVLVPTTVLAQQHLATFRRRFADSPVSVEALSRFQKPALRRDIVRRLKEGRVDVVIGTHRLLSGDVHFKNLGLLIIDEEHRFGVAQKERIKFLRPGVDVLTMTATPIPRTLQMSIGKMLELSLIATPPAHRLPIRTQVIRWNDGVIRDAVMREIDRGGQVFFLHNRVESIDRVLEKLRALLPAVRFDVAHGQMKPEALERVMVDFVSGRVDVLVCTAIIESGLDIPNANTIFVSDVHTLGLAQLYQIRGRIGRAAEQAYAYFILPERMRLTPEARQRVDALMRLSELGSGFGLAAMDLEIRGAGDLLGSKQSGHIRKVGFELYCEMLEEAAATLRGEAYTPDIEPEIKMNVSAYIPESYVEDAGLRLSFYKRMASAAAEGQVWEIVEEIEDRFGELPAEVKTLRELMIIKVLLRRLGAYGIEAGPRRVQLHLSDRTPVSPERIIDLIQRRRDGRDYKMTPEGKLALTVSKQRHPISLSREFLDEIFDLADGPAASTAPR